MRSIPNVPTFREQGFDLLATEWYGLLAPAGTPKPIVAKLNAEMRRILALPLGERLAAIELSARSPEELGSFIRSEIDRWTPVIKKLGLKAELRHRDEHLQAARRRRTGGRATRRKTSRAKARAG